MATETPLSKANTCFALDLFKKFGDNDRTANVFYSPFSVSSALAMVLLGAGGNTATQTSECLKTNALSDDVHSQFGSLLLQLDKSDAPYALNVANRLYGEQTYQFVEDFLGGIRNYYKAELEAVDFAGNSEGARTNINNWVENKTQGKIKDLLAQGVMDGLTKLVLVNAIYFKANWAKPFWKRDTQDHKFRINKNDTKPVKMMKQELRLPLKSIPEANCQIIDLPYKGRELSMLIFLPNDIEDSTTGLEKLEQQLTYENFVEWTCPDMMDVTNVQLGLPRFKVAETYNMKNVLMSMGMVDAFDMAKSDFSGMSPVKGLSLSQVVHKAFVDVNEEGTEAAAATGVMARALCGYLHTSFFIADHPFLFFIRHNASNSILFAGRYCSPE